MGGNHAFVGELRIGSVAVEKYIPELGFTVEIGEVVLTGVRDRKSIYRFKNGTTAIYAWLWAGFLAKPNAKLFQWLW